MSPGELWRLVRLLGRVSRPSEPAMPPPLGVEELRGQGDHHAGLAFDLYRPRRPLLGGVVALHGATVHHRRDHRLVHFARSLAQGRVGCLVPTLPGMARCRFEPADIDVVVAALAQARDTFGARVGLLGFSLGGTYGLLAAARAPTSVAPRFVVTFGAYHDMGRLLQQSTRLARAAPRTALQWDQAVYLPIALAHGYPDAAGLSLAARDAANDLLERYCAGVPLQEKQAFHQRHLRGRDIVGAVVSQLEPEAIAGLSAHGRLGGLGCPVSLIHDRHDVAVPPDHLDPLYAELPHRPGPVPPHRKVLTSLLSHVAVGGRLRLTELWRLCAALAPVVRPGPASLAEAAPGASTPSRPPGGA